VYLDRALVKALARDRVDRFPTVERFAEAVMTKVQGGAALTEDKSVAVLPFTSMSADPDSEYFGDGIAEEIINALSRLPGLRVAARASAFAFRGKADDLRGIATQLGVRTVLEGSVRRAGHRVRITAQLVDVDDGFQIWSERYDRELTDIFAIQDEIATAIAKKFELALGGGDAGRLVQPGTSNLQAYDLYIRGRALLHRRGASTAQAIESFEQAVAIDPDYAPAHAGLARALVLYAFWGWVEPDSVLGRASEAATDAVRSDARLGEAHAAAALVAFSARFDLSEAHAAWGRAIGLAPESDVETRVGRAMFDLGYAQGRFSEAADEIAAALVADPLSPSGHAGLAVMRRSAGQVEAARAAARRALELDPESLYAYWAILYALSGGDAIEEIRRCTREAMARLGRHPWLMMGEALNLPKGADRSAADAHYEELAARSRTDYVQPAVLSLMAASVGRIDESAVWLRRAAESHDALILALVAQYREFGPVLERPDVRALVQEGRWATASGTRPA
jgi:serine/threonine-protein kinase